MKKKLFVISLLLLLTSGYSYVSKFLELPTNSIEYRLILNPESFSLKEGALIAAGVKEEFLTNYLNTISEFENEINQNLSSTNDKIEISKMLFNGMHKKFLKKYKESDTTLDELLKTGGFNCLSSTLLYSSLLEDYKIEYKAIIVPTHVFTMLTFPEMEIDVENTSPYGYDIGNNKEAQENFKKLTGFTYPTNKSLSEIVDKRGLLGYTYANIAYFASQSGQVFSAFQNALKSLAIYPQGKYIYTNVVASYNQYILYLTDTKKDYVQALSILEEAFKVLPPKNLFFSNYFYVLDKYLNSLIESSQYEKAIEEYDKSKGFSGENKDIENNLYTRILYRLIEKEQNFPKAFEIGKKILSENKNCENIKSLLINGLNILTKKYINTWKTFPEGEGLVIKWYGLMKSKDFDEILEDYYNQIALKYYGYGNPDKGIEIIKRGLSYFPNSGLLKNNAVYICANTANTQFKKENYPEGIKYTKIGLSFDPKNEALRSNLLTAYKIMVNKEIEKQNYSVALNLTEEALKTFPGDSKLLYYKDYIKRKLKK